MAEKVLHSTITRYLILQKGLHMGSIDDMKKNLNIDNLDKKLREKMFKELVDKGGKVVSDSKKKAIKFDRNRQKELKKIEIEQQKKRKQQSILKSGTGSAAGTRTSMKVQEKKKKKTKRRFGAYFQGLMAKVFTISWTFNKGFSGQMKENLKQLFEELEQTTLLFLSLKDEQKWQAFEELNKIDPLGYEIITRVNRLVKQENLTPIIEYLSGKAGIACSPIVSNITYILKELYILYPAKKKITEVLAAADTIYAEKSSLKKKIVKDTFEKTINRLYGYYLTRLFHIVNYNSGTNYKPTYKQIGLLLQINTEYDLGSITEAMTADKTAYEKELEKAKEEERKKEQEKEGPESGIPKTVQKGLVLIERIIKSIPERLKHDKVGTFFESNEKMLILYFLLRAFDERHSFIMTTFQIEFEPILVERERIDIKLDLDKISLKFNDLLKLIKDYAKLLEEFHYINNNHTMKEHLRKSELDKIHRNRLKMFQDIHFKMSQFFKNFSKILQVLIKDYNNEKRLIENPDDLLVFKLSKIQHFFEKTPIIKAVMITFAYTSAVYYYMSYTVVNNNNLYVEEKK